MLECVSRPRRGRRTHRRMRGCRPARLWVKGVTIVIENHLTASDAGPLAKLHRRAFPGFVLSRLGEPFLRQLYLGFVDDETAVTVVERDARGVPRGVAVGTIDPVGFYSRLLRRRWAGFALASVLAVIRDPRTAPRLVAAVNYRGDAVPGRAGALLSSICVDPALSGTGVGHALLAAWRQRASELGAEVAFLTTDADANEATNRFYLRDGWTLNDQFVTKQGRRMNRYVRGLYQDGRWLVAQ